MLVEVPIKVQVPPNNAEKEMGINNIPGAILVSLHTVNAMGKSSATTAESFTNAENMPAIRQKVIRAML